MTVRLRALKSDCGHCALRAGCGNSNHPAFRKEIEFTARLAPRADKLIADSKHHPNPCIGAPTTYAQTNGPSASASPPSPGPFVCAMSRLRLGLLLELHERAAAVRSCAICVTVASETYPRLPPAIAATAAERQQRRKTLDQRTRWNALPDGSVIEILHLQPLQSPPTFEQPTCRSAA